MNKRRQVLKSLLLGGAGAFSGGLPIKLLAGTNSKVPDLTGLQESKLEGSLLQNGATDRKYWADLLYKMADPVLSNLANDSLKKNMIVKKSPTYDNRSISVTYLEAVGRTMAGVAPWLSLPDEPTVEGKMRKQLKDKALQGIAHSVDPKASDYLNFRTDMQPIVDSAYLAQSFIRAREALWEPLDTKTKQHVIREFKALRNRKPFDSNWVIFGAMTEAFLLSIGEDYDKERLIHGVERLKSWYVGDGWYSDGPRFAFDYYNAYVMHPFMVDTLKILSAHNLAPKQDYELACKRMIRYAEQQEKMISPEGTFPPIGRSITYRTGAFQALAMVAWQDNLPEHIDPAQVRCALTKVCFNMFTKMDSFDSHNWLQLGFCGLEPAVADYYTSTGSLYMATLSFLPLGLPANHPFWTRPPADWTAKAAWSGKSFYKDYHVDY